MNRPTPEQVEQFSRLIHTQVHQYIQAAVLDTQQALESTASTVKTFRIAQGRLQALRAILQLIESKKA